MHAQCTAEIQGSRNPAFPAQWFDGLCRALPGADLPSGLPRLRELTMRFTRLGFPHLREGLTVATTARTTRFSRTRCAVRRQRLAGAHEARLNPLPRPAPDIRTDAARVHRSPARVRDAVRPPLGGLGWGEILSQIRISVKWNLLRERLDIPGLGVFRRSALRRWKVQAPGVPDTRSLRPTRRKSVALMVCARSNTRRVGAASFHRGRSNAR